MTTFPAAHVQKVLDRLHKKSQAVLEHSPETQKWLTSQGTLELIDDRSRTCIDLFEEACRQYGDRPAIGLWNEESSDKALSPPDEARKPSVRYVTYRDLWQRIATCAAGLKNAGICDAHDRVGILGFASADFLVADLACLYVGAVSIPLQAGAPAHELTAIVREAEISCLFCSRDQWPTLRALLPDCCSVQHVVLIDDENGTLESRQVNVTDREAIQVHPLCDIERIGREGVPVPKHTPDRLADPMVTVMYTSGSTGSPKGAVLTESMWYLRLRSLVKLGATAPFIHLNYLPLNHLAGRLNCARALLVGGMTHFTRKSDLSTLFADIQLVRPTQLLLVPRVSAMIYQHFALEVLRRGGRITKEASDQSSDNDQHHQDDVCREMRSTFLGDRVLSLSVGTAPTPPHILGFLEDCFQVPVMIGYGSTEGSIISSDHHIMEDVVDAYKLVDVPELGYFSTDKPHPRGELRIKSRQMVREYLNNPEATKTLLDSEGFLQTGDIVEERGPGHVVWLDRVKNVLKLSQGEFVTLWSLETLYSSQSPYISQVYLYGQSSRAYLLAVVVPNLTAWGCPSIEAFRLIGEDDIKRRIKAELIRIAQEHQLKSFEIPRDFIVEPEPFTVANRLLTESNKLSRKNLQARYGHHLEALYNTLDERQLASIAAICDQKGGLSAEEKLISLIETSLNVKTPDLSLSFKELGGDSMAALEFAATLEAALSIKIPVSLILNPRGPLRDIVTYIERMENGTNPQVSVASIHGNHSSRLRASDLTLERFLTPEEIHAAHELATTWTWSDKSPKKILVTGANGFLGRFLAKDLATFSQDFDTVYCLVRAKSDDLARERFIDSFGTLDQRLLNKISEFITQGRIQVLAGDLIQPNFGLAPDKYQQLASEIDTILHNGALVNHVFSYEDLFEPNVLGTVEVIRFAIKKRLKKIAFVSSIAAIQGTALVREEDDIRAKIPERPINEGYANGYGVSKWACEVLLRHAEELFGLPTAVFRCGMILAARQSTGQINPDDLVSRLVFGLIRTGTAPGSFYRRDKGPKLAFSGLPVDFVSHAISSITRDLKERQFATYHVVSPQSATGGSLDDFVDWIISAGYPIKRIHEHDTWYRTFVEKLSQLDEKSKQHSPLAIVHQWQSPMESGAYDVPGPLFWETCRQTRGVDSHPLGNYLNESFIHKCLGDLRALRLLENPQTGILN